MSENDKYESEIRQAQESDITEILEIVSERDSCERLAGHFITHGGYSHYPKIKSQLTEQSLRKDVFCGKPLCTVFVAVAEDGRLSGYASGHSVYDFRNGKSGFKIQDLYIRFHDDPDCESRLRQAIYEHARLSL